jgi:hypothetical protein
VRLRWQNRDSGEDPGDHHRVRPAGPNGPLIPEIHANAPHAQYVARKGEINAWDNPEFRGGGKRPKAQDADHRYHHQRLHGLPSISAVADDKGVCGD